jgi:hypothetical protein
MLHIKVCPAFLQRSTSSTPSTFLKRFLDFGSRETCNSLIVLESLLRLCALLITTIDSNTVGNNFQTSAYKLVKMKRGWIYETSRSQLNQNNPLRPTLTSAAIDSPPISERDTSSGATGPVSSNWRNRESQEGSEHFQVGKSSDPNGASQVTGKYLPLSIAC